MSFTEIVAIAVIMFLLGMKYGILIDKRIERDLDQKTWERIEGWRK